MTGDAMTRYVGSEDVAAWLVVAVLPPLALVAIASAGRVELGWHSGWILDMAKLAWTR